MDDGPPLDDAAPATPLATGGFASLVRSSAVFSLGSVAGKVLGVALLPVVTRRLSPEGFGRYDVMLTLATTVTSLAIAGLDVAATRRYADTDDAGRRTTFGTWLAIATGVVLVLLAALVGGAGTISVWLFGSSDNALGVAMVGAYAAGNVYQVVGLTALRNQGRAAAYAVVSTGAFAVNAIAVLILVLRRPEADAAMVGVAIGTAFGGVGAIAFSRRLVVHRPSAEAARSLLRLGLPLVPAVAALWVGDFANRAVLLGAKGAAEVGYLSVAVRFGTVAVLVVTGFQLAWLPRAYVLARSPDGLARTAIEARRIIALVSASIVPFAVLAPELVTLLAGRDYSPAVPVIGWTLAASVGLALFTVAGMSSSIAARMGDLGIAGTVGAVAGVAANVGLAPKWGAAGTGAALAIGQLVGVVVLLRIGRDRTDLELPWGHIAVVSGAACALAVAVTVVDDVALPVRLAAGLAFVGVLAAVGDLGEIVRYVRSLLDRRGGGAEPTEPT